MLPTFFACVFLFPTQNAYYTFGILLGVNFVTSIIGTLSYSIFPDLEKISKGIFGLYSLLGMYLAIALVFFTPQNEYSANYKQIFESGQCEKLDSGLLNTSREYCINLHKEAEDKAGKYVIISIVNILNTDNSLGCRVKFVRDSVMGYGLSFTESDLKISCDTLKIGDKRSLILKPKTNKSLIHWEYSTETIIY
jgi:hypothetical protein